MFAIDKLSISKKLPVLILTSALLSSVIVGAIGYFEADFLAHEEVESRLGIIADMHAAELDSYLDNVEEDLHVLGASPLVKRSLVEFSQAYSELGSGAQDYLQRTYIETNPHPAGSKQELTFTTDGSRYSLLHGDFHPWFHEIQKTRGYYDVFLIDASGSVVYTVFKERDFATNLIKGDWRATDLHAMFERAMKAPSSQPAVFTDFAAYAPSNGAPASFMGIAIRDEAGEPLGVLAFQMPIDRISSVMNHDAGLGETGSAMIVGPDGLMRSQSRFTDDNTVLKAKVTGALVSDALEGKAGLGVEETDGERFLRVVRPFEHLGVTWAIVAQYGIKEVMAPIIAIRNQMIIAALITLIIVGMIGYFAARPISSAIVAMTKVMSRLQSGDTTVAIPTGHKDELGDMARSLVVFRENLLERLRLQQQSAAEQDLELRRQAVIKELIAGFEAKMRQSFTSVGEEATRMKAVAETLGGVANVAAKEAAVALHATEGASSNVQGVASATEELSASIREIAEVSQRSHVLVSRAYDTVAATDLEVKALDGAAKSVGSVVELIREIAEQTNLLALNATIEAARAGEMGKGFAIVASEVKSLANQTAKATDDIAAKIGGMQTSTEGAVSAIARIRDAVSELNQVAATIASAVEEQRAATDQIAGLIQSTSDGTTSASQNVKSVDGAIQKTAQEAAVVLKSTKTLTDEIEDYSDVVEEFLKNVTQDVEERRASTRRRVREVVVTDENGRTETGTVLDASSSSARVAPNAGRRVGARLTVQFADGQRHVGTVARIQDDSFVLKFDGEVIDTLRLNAA